MADVDGKWECSVMTPMGEQDFVLSVARNGDRFSGEASGSVGSMSIPDGLVEQADQVIVEIGGLLRAAAGNRRHLGQRGIRLPQRNAGIAARSLDQAGRHALLVFEQGLEQMFGADTLVRIANGNGLRGLQEPLGAIGQLFEIHKTPSSARDMVLPFCNTSPA